LTGPSELAPPRRLFLVDAMGLLFRAHFAFVGRPMTTSAGLPVGALFGFINALLAILRDEDGRFVAVAFDSAGPTFRHERFPEYKAHRPPAPPELLAQIPYLRRFVEALGVARLEQPGLEADDLIGSLAVHCTGLGWQAVIVSADKDFMQLIGPGVRQFVPPRGSEPARWVDAQDVRAKCGVTPAQFIDYQALTGDAVDNIPGVKGIGPKTAASLLQAYGSLDEIYAHLDSVTPAGLQRRLAEGRASAQLSRELVTIRIDVCAADPEDFRVPDPAGREELRGLLRELEFRRLEQRIFASGGPASAPAPLAAPQRRASVRGEGRAVQGSLLDQVSPPASGAVQDAPGVAAGAGESAPPVTATATPIVVADGWGSDYLQISDPRELRAFLTEHAGGAGALAIDTETSGLDPRRSALVGISLAWLPGRAAYIPIGHRRGPVVALDEVRALLAPLLEDESSEKLGQNLGFDMQVLQRHGLAMRGALRDTMLASYVRDPEARHGLDDLTWEFLAHRKIPTTALIGKGRAQVGMDELTPEQVAGYACEDVDAVVRIWPLLRSRVCNASGWRLFEEVEMPLVPVLVAMETRGIALDALVLAGLGEKLEVEMRVRISEIHRLAGRVFNVDSPKQLQEILYADLKLAPGRRTKTGFSTDQDVLQELAAAHPLPREVLEYRMLAKLRGTYVEALPRMRDPQTGRVHTQFHQAVTATGRLSSSDPNLQNIPVRSPLGREIRKAFVAPPGRVLLSADYSQVELRVLAHLSQDPDLLAAFAQGADIHRATAARVYGVTDAEVTAQMRGRAKTVNFGLIYGMGAPRLAVQLGIPVKEAGEFIRAYFEKLPGMKRYVEGCIARARELGYAETLLGRRRYLPALALGPGRERAAAERMALNTTIQGSAADLIKAAMVRLHARLEEHHPSAHMLLQVHDELVLEVAASELEAVTRVVRETMESVMTLRAPLRVDCGHGANWYEAHV
jgi:DNA polymerase I